MRSNLLVVSSQKHMKCNPSPVSMLERQLVLSLPTWFTILATHQSKNVTLCNVGTIFHLICILTRALDFVYRLPVWHFSWHKMFTVTGLNILFNIFYQFYSVYSIAFRLTRKSY